MSGGWRSNNNLTTILILILILLRGGGFLLVVLLECPLNTLNLLLAVEYFADLVLYLGVFGLFDSVAGLRW